MKFQQACEQAARVSKEHPDCSVHVSGKIVLDNYGVPIIDTDSWASTDWYDSGSCVLTYVNGKVHE